MSLATVAAAAAAAATTTTATTFALTRKVDADGAAA
jgi:hypothetical protein